MTPSQLAWAALMGAARVFAATENDDTRRELSRTAIEYGKVRVPKPTGVADDRSSAVTVFPPYGRAKGQPIAGASQKDLEFYHAGCLRSLEDPTKSRFHPKERLLLAAIEAEMES